MIAQKIVDNGSGMGAALRRERERLIKPLVQERNGPLPGNTSSLGVILRAILLEEPMFGPWIRMDSDLPPRSLERLLHRRSRLSRVEGVILREVAEVGGRSSAIVQSGVGVIKGHDCGDLLGQGDGHVERVGASQREADEGELAATVRQLGRIVLAPDLHRPRDVAAPPLHIPIHRLPHRWRSLDRRGRLAAVEVWGERHEARFREPVADLPKRLCQSPPGMQDQHPWAAAMFGNGQIGADRSPISLKFSHTTLLKNARNTVLQEAENTCFVCRWPKYPFLDGSLEQCSVPASLDNCEATAPSYIVSTDVNSGATRHTSNPFFQAKAKTVTGREDWRCVRDGDEMRNKFLPQHSSRHNPTRVTKPSSRGSSGKGSLLTCQRAALCQRVVSRLS